MLPLDNTNLNSSCSMNSCNTSGGTPPSPRYLLDQTQQNDWKAMLITSRWQKPCPPNHFVILSPPIRELRAPSRGDHMRTPLSPREPLQSLDTRLRLKNNSMSQQQQQHQSKVLHGFYCREDAAYQRTYSANDTTLNRLKSALVGLGGFHFHFLREMKDFSLFSAP